MELTDMLAWNGDCTRHLNGRATRQGVDAETVDLSVVRAGLSIERENQLHIEGAGIRTA